MEQERAERERLEREKQEKDRQEREHRERLERERRILKESVDSHAAVDQHFSESLRLASQRVRFFWAFVRIVLRVSNNTGKTWVYVFNSMVLVIFCKKSN